MFVTTSVAVLAFGLVSGQVAAFSPATVSSKNVVHSGTASSSALDMATWSDSRAVKDYQEFLNSGAREMELKEDGPSIVLISPSEAGLEFQQLNPIAQALLHMGRGDDIILTPYQELPATLGEGESATSEYPIYITLPPTEILPFIQNLDEAYSERTDDFVFFSGGLQFGNIEEVLKEYGFCREDMTQVMISGLQVDENGITDKSVKLGVDAVGEEKIAGESSACGKWKGAIAKRLERNQMRCAVDFYRDWRRKMWERNLLDAIFNLVGCVREEPTTIQDVANYYEQEVSDMIWEITGSLRAWKAVTLLYGFEERLLGVAEANTQQCTLVEDRFPYIWGNQVFLNSPKVLEYLHYAQSQRGFIPGVQLPPMKESSELSNVMRQGNLRADGVI
ncbi:hypothetical protein IV203_022356 [Nitzschia inconspicua]|uniref:Uncharacterized protein n=1 Tax=Nitzschia inconspicua TaxID=303405 RepID=A0A9K3KII8_9STRA|nr:hypothetical protein IV203_022356 [Nitzschia inconspicua]